MTGSARLAVAAALVGVALLAVAPAGCGADPREEQFVRTVEAGVDADAMDDREPDLDPTLGGPCTEDAQCNDMIPCTADRCDMGLLRCRNTPDDTQCPNDSYCLGLKKCVIRQGCVAGPVVTCQDDDPCTIDRCDDDTKTCEHKPRDLDGDGDPDYHCVGMRDCDDLDPNVSSQRAEICQNGKDDDCDGTVDEAACVQAANDVCGTALPVTAKGTYLLTTVAAKRDFNTTCSVATPSAAKDIVVKITVPGIATDPVQDVEIWATSQTSTNEIAVAVQATCGQIGSELACAHITASPSARTIARAVVPGTAIYAIVTTQTEGAVDVKVDIRKSSPKPTNDGCGAPTPVAGQACTVANQAQQCLSGVCTGGFCANGPFTVSLIDPSPIDNVPTACDKGRTGDLTYSFTLTDTRDVSIFASTLVGTGLPIVSLRKAGACIDELRCRLGTTPPLYARSLAAGTYVFTVAGTRHIDANILVQTSVPPTIPEANERCETAPPLTVLPAKLNGAFTVDLSKHEGAILNGCLPGSPAAAYELVLTQPSDVLIIGRFPPNEGGAISLHDVTGANPAMCTTANSKGCSMGSTPQRLSKRNLPAGTYRVVIADELGQTAQLNVLVRPYTPPTPVGASDSCVAPFTIPSTGGFFAGDTTNPAADFNAGCDAPGQPIGGAKDQMMRLDLAQPQRVVFDMTGSVYTTILDIRKGSTCPGTEVQDACYVGFNANRSFLDLPLTAGTHWVQVDGFNSDRGAWFLDVRVLPPSPP